MCMQTILKFKQAMLACRVKNSKVCKNKYQKQTEIENSPKVVYRIYKNPQIDNSTISHHRITIFKGTI